MTMHVNAYSTIRFNVYSSEFSSLIWFNRHLDLAEKAQRWLNRPFQRWLNRPFQRWLSQI